MDWAPLGDDPRRKELLWLYNDKRKALVEEVTTAWVQGKEIGVKDLTCEVGTSIPKEESGDSSDSDVESLGSSLNSEEEFGPSGGVVGLA